MSDEYNDRPTGIKIISHRPVPPTVRLVQPPQEPATPSGFRIIDRREILPVSRVFSFPEHMRPQGHPGIFIPTGLMGELRFMAKHALPNEDFALLLGFHFIDPQRNINWVEVNYSIDHPPTMQATPVRFETTMEEMALMRERSDEIAARSGYEGERLLGWYHSHPGHGIFFSDTDRDNHSGYGRDYQFGLVIDPVRGEEGIFQGPQMQRVEPTIVSVDLYSHLAAEQQTQQPYLTSSFNPADFR